MFEVPAKWRELVQAEGAGLIYEKGCVRCMPSEYHSSFLSCYRQSFCTFLRIREGSSERRTGKLAHLTRKLRSHEPDFCGPSRSARRRLAGADYAEEDPLVFQAPRAQFLGYLQPFLTPAGGGIASRTAGDTGHRLRLSLRRVPNADYVTRAVRVIIILY